MKKMMISLVALMSVLATGEAMAQRREPGTGPVAGICAEDAGKFCTDKEHGNRAIRTCLEANRDKVSAECRQALDTTGPGRGQGRNRPQ